MCNSQAQQCQLPSEYQDMEIDLHEVGPCLSHIPNSKTLRQQEKEAERYQEYPSPTPLAHTSS